MWAEKTAEFPVLCAQYHCKPMVPLESVQSEGVSFDGLNPPDMKNIIWETPNPENGFRKFVLSILSKVEKCAEFK